MLTVFSIWDCIWIRGEIQLSTVKKVAICKRQSSEREATFAFGEDWGRALSTRRGERLLFGRARTWPRNSGNEKTHYRSRVYRSRSYTAYFLSFCPEKRALLTIATTTVIHVRDRVLLSFIKISLLPLFLLLICNNRIRVYVNCRPMCRSRDPELFLRRTNSIR